ncbi:MAG: DUF1624 domain-containing protein [Gammaproteobacteria bacterium]
MNRLIALDWLRGLVMVLMALDHASIFYNPGRLALDSATTYTEGVPLPPEQFLTRWLTHLCAPTFVFLAGTVLALSVDQRVARADPPQHIDRDLLIRGAVVASFDLVFAPLIGGKWVLQVMFAIGASLVLMVALRRVCDAWLLLLALGWFVGGEWLATHFWEPSQRDPPVGLAVLMAVYYSPHLVILYPVLPWLAVMLSGWVFGRYLSKKGASPQNYPVSLLALLGIVLFWTYLVVRAANGYGNMGLLRGDESWVQWLHVSKYPPSLSFITIELSIMALICALLMVLERYIKPSRNNLLVVFGQTPMFFYFLHFSLLALSKGVLEVGGAGGLAWAYGAAAIVLTLLYPFCRWYRNYKFAHPQSLTRYL